VKTEYVISAEITDETVTLASWRNCHLLVDSETDHQQHCCAIYDLNYN